MEHPDVPFVLTWMKGQKSSIKNAKLALVLD
jgi:hypothetical protein